jgi:hypothetical protein
VRKSIRRDIGGRAAGRAIGKQHRTFGHHLNLFLQLAGPGGAVHALFAPGISKSLTTIRNLFRDQRVSVGWQASISVALHPLRFLLDRLCQPDGSIDPGTVMIRVRRVAHLSNLQKRFPALADGEIVTLPNRDYRYRLIVSKEVWAATLAELGREQDWANFKDEAAKLNGHDEYVNALHKIWDVMYQLQSKKERKNAIHKTI